MAAFPGDPQAPDWRAERFSRAYVKTRHLVLLVELGRHGSILQAARAANLTQPTASRMLGELEDALGRPLFERLRRGVAPTDEGIVLIRRAGAALAELAAAHQEVMALKSGAAASVRIGAMPAPAASLLPAAVALLKSRHARVDVAISVDGSTRLVERLRAGELDIVVGHLDGPAAAAGLRFEPVGDTPHRLIVRAGHPLAGLRDPGLGALARHAWILPPAGSALRERIALLFLAHGLEQPAGSVSTASLPTAASLLMGSDMMAPLPVELVRPYLDSALMAALPFDLTLPAQVVGLVTRRQHRLAPGAEALLAALRETVVARRPPP